MVSKVGITGAGITVAATALGMLFMQNQSLSRRLDEESSARTVAIRSFEDYKQDTNASWNRKLETEKTERAKSEEIYSKHKADMAKKLTELAAGFKALQNLHTSSKVALDNYSQALQLARQEINNKIGGLETTQKLTSEKITNFKNIEAKISSLAEQIVTREISQKALASTVGVNVFNIDERRSNVGHGWVTQNDEGKYAILTSGHFWKDADSFTRSIVTITFPDEFLIRLTPRPLEDGSIPLSGSHQTDVALILLTENEGKILSHAGIKGLPLRSVTQDVEVREPIVLIGSPFGKQFSTSDGRISNFYFYTNFDGLTYRRDYQVDASMNDGNSGGPGIDTKGRTVGMVSWRQVSPARIINKDGKVEKDLRIIGNGSIGIGFLVSNLDIAQVVDLRWGWKILSDKDRKHMIRENVLENLEILTPSVGGGLGANFSAFAAKMMEIEPAAYKQ